MKREVLRIVPSSAETMYDSPVCPIPSFTHCLSLVITLFTSSNGTWNARTPTNSWPSYTGVARNDVGTLQEGAYLLVALIATCPFGRFFASLKVTARFDVLNGPSTSD